MGIEPTSPTFIARLNGFEDRGHHQVCKHFRHREHLNLTKSDLHQALLEKLRRRLAIRKLEDLSGGLWDEWDRWDECDLLALSAQ